MSLNIVADEHISDGLNTIFSVRMEKNIKNIYFKAKHNYQNNENRVLLILIIFLMNDSGKKFFNVVTKEKL